MGKVFGPDVQGFRIEANSATLRVKGFFPEHWRSFQDKNSRLLYMQQAELTGQHIRSLIIEGKRHITLFETDQGITNGDCMLPLYSG
jgi:hypothetical protein